MIFVGDWWFILWLCFTRPIYPASVRRPIADKRDVICEQSLYVCDVWMGCFLGLPHWLWHETPVHLIENSLYLDQLNVQKALKVNDIIDYWLEVMLWWTFYKKFKIKKKTNVISTFISLLHSVFSHFLIKSATPVFTRVIWGIPSYCVWTENTVKSSRVCSAVMWARAYKDSPQKNWHKKWERRNLVSEINKSF